MRSSDRISLLIGSSAIIRIHRSRRPSQLFIDAVNSWRAVTFRDARQSPLTTVDIPLDIFDHGAGRR